MPELAKSVKNKKRESSNIIPSLTRTSNRVDVLIMAAGCGERFGKKKQFVTLGGTPVINITVNLFTDIHEINRIYIVYPPDMKKIEVRRRGKLDKDFILVKGHTKREESVKRGLSAVGSEYVLIHDAVRPASSKKLIRRIIRATLKFGSAVPAINPVSTVKYMENGVLKSLDRNKVYFIQTPQGYKTSEIKRAYEEKRNGGFTDSSTVAQKAGMKIKIVRGEADNIKITFPQDYNYLIKTGLRNK